MDGENGIELTRGEDNQGSSRDPDLKIIAEKQMTRMNSIAEVLTKAKKVNKFNEKDDIVNIDDILVQMAILQMKKCTHDLVFYIRICYGAKKWT